MKTEKRNLLKKAKPYKICPRCGNKCLVNQTRCEECDLLFSRLEFASNTAAKKQLRRFDRDYIIYTKTLPKDVSYVKLLLYSIFFGIFGGHYYYVGKYIKGFLMTLSFVWLIVCTAFNAQLSVLMETMYLYFPIGLAAFSWMISVAFVLSKKFTVPILVDIPESVQEEMKAKRIDFEKVSESLKEENLKMNKNKVDKSTVSQQSFSLKGAKKENDVVLKKKSEDSFKIIEKVLGIKK